MEAIAGDNTTPSPGGYDEEDDNDSIYSRESQSLETQEEAPDAAYNIRIKSHRYYRDLETEDDYGNCFSFSYSLQSVLIFVSNFFFSSRRRRR
jgi:hypothetical protein